MSCETPNIADCGTLPTKGAAGEKPADFSTKGSHAFRVSPNAFAATAQE
jgi:hypothetical protein